MCALQAASVRKFYRLGQYYEGAVHAGSFSGCCWWTVARVGPDTSVNEVTRQQSSVTTRPRLLGGYVANTTDSGDAATNTGWTDMTGPSKGTAG